MSRNLSLRSRVKKIDFLKINSFQKNFFSFKANHSTSHFSTSSKLAKRYSASEYPIDAKR